MPRQDADVALGGPRDDDRRLARPDHPVGRNQLYAQFACHRLSSSEMIVGAPEDTGRTPPVRRTPSSPPSQNDHGVHPCASIPRLASLGMDALAWGWPLGVRFAALPPRPLWGSRRCSVIVVGICGALVMIVVRLGCHYHDRCERRGALAQ